MVSLPSVGTASMPFMKGWVLVAARAQDRRSQRFGRDERGGGVEEHAETHCSVSWRCWSLSYATATAAALQQAAPRLALDP